MQPLPEPTETQPVEPSAWYALLGAPFFIIGIFLAVSTYYTGMRQVAASVTQFVVPGGVLLDLQPNETYTLFQEKGVLVKGKTYSDFPMLTMMACGLTKVVDSQVIELKRPNPNTAYSTGTRQGRPMFDFVVPSAGQYDFTCEKKADATVPDGVVAIGAKVGDNVNGMLRHCYTSLFIGCGLGLLISLIVLMQRELSKRRIRAEGYRPV